MAGLRLRPRTRPGRATTVRAGPRGGGLGVAREKLTSREGGWKMGREAGVGTGKGAGGRGKDRIVSRRVLLHVDSSCHVLPGSNYGHILPCVVPCRIASHLVTCITTSTMPRRLVAYPAMHQYASRYPIANRAPLSLGRVEGERRRYRRKSINYYRRKCLTIEGNPLLQKDIPYYRRNSLTIEENPSL